MNRLAPIARIVVVTLGALAIVFAILAVSGHDLVSSSKAFWVGSFGSWRGFGVALTGSCPLILTGLGVAIAFRCGVLNIGAEGQLLMGALWATTLAVNADLPAWLFAPILFAMGCVGGGIWAAVASLLRIRRGVPEVLSTIMLNFVAVEMVKYAVTGPLEGVPGTSQTAEPPASARLWTLNRSTDLHAGIFVALIAAVLVYLLIHRTTFGFELRAVGSNPTAARYAGMSVSRRAFAAMVLSGCLSGLAGTVELLGRVGALSQGFTTVGYGYTAIAVAMLARLNPLGVVASALFFGALASGSREMTFAPNFVPDKLVEMTQGLIVLLAIGYGAVQLRFDRDR